MSPFIVKPRFMTPCLRHKINACPRFSSKRTFDGFKIRCARLSSMTRDERFDTTRESCGTLFQHCPQRICCLLVDVSANPKVTENGRVIFVELGRDI